VAAHLKRSGQHAGPITSVCEGHSPG
jgi:hypothetical protein